MKIPKIKTSVSNSNKPRLFISYKQESKSIEIAGFINDQFRDTCSVCYDVDSLNLRDDIERYMELIKHQDIVVLIISKEFMQSLNCIYEASLLMNTVEWEQKAVIIATDNSGVFDHNSVQKSTLYWRKKFNEYKKGFNEEECTEEEKKEFNKLKKVSDCISPFADYVKCHIMAKINEGFNEIKRMVSEIENNKVSEIFGTKAKSITVLLEKTKVNNVYIVRKGVDYIENYEFQKLLEEYNNKFMQLPVCVIYTGGSAGEIRELEGDMQSTLRQADLEELIDRLHNLSALPYDVHFFKLDIPINSANISSKDWMSLAKVIENLYESYSGFVIIHGSHTIAYTASALSFMFSNLTKPIILTGSELPLDFDKTDAPTNIMRSLSLINSKYNINEISVFYSNELLRGNRTTKKKALDIKQAFHSPNYRPLAIMEGSKPSLKVVFSNRKGKPIVFSNLPNETKILTIEITPDMDNNMMELILKKEYWNAIIIRTFGLGEISLNMKNVFKEYISDGGIVVSIPKSEIGENCTDLTSIEKYLDLYDMGVVIGGDMVPEAAYCKIAYLMGKYGHDTEKIKNELPVNIAGELSVSMHNASVKSYCLDPVNDKLEIKHLKFRIPFALNKKTCSITIQLISLNVFDNYKDTTLAFSFYTDDQYNNCIFSYKREFAELPSSLSLNFEIEDKKVNEFIDENNEREFSLFVDTSHALQIESVNIIAFVKEEA